MHHKHHGHHEGVKHAGAHMKDSYHGDKGPKSTNHKAMLKPGESGNGCAHMAWGSSEHHSGHHYKK